MWAGMAGLNGVAPGPRIEPAAGYWWLLAGLAAICWLLPNAMEFMARAGIGTPSRSLSRDADRAAPDLALGADAGWAISARWRLRALPAEAQRCLGIPLFPLLSEALPDRRGAQRDAGLAAFAGADPGRHRHPRDGFEFQALLAYQLGKIAAMRAQDRVPDSVFLGDSALGNGIDAERWTQLSGGGEPGADLAVRLQRRSQSPWPRPGDRPAAQRRRHAHCRCRARAREPGGEPDDPDPAQVSLLERAPAVVAACRST